MARTTESREPETIGLPAVGQEGDVCTQCGSVLATDQRYCLNCGWRRGEPRVDYETRMMNGAQAPAAAAAPALAPAGFQQSPLFAVGTIALLGIMLLLGVLIGKDDNGGTQTVAAAPAQTTTPATTTTPTASAAGAGAGANKTKAAADTGKSKVVQGGTGSAEGVATVDPSALENAAQSGQGAQAGKNLPDQVATPGQQAELDPNGPAGGGSSGTCIGC